ncbi:MAG: hypothetical protein LBS07_02170 [Prevotellaceae bacterium]|jgi:hypothetical protein|nr:hypothetical protein [Prevotellaceae bacterium]
MSIKDELQCIILGNEYVGNANQLKIVQNFLRGNAQISYGSQDKKFVKRQEEKYLINFAETNNLFYPGEISERNFVTEGTEQQVYRYNDFQVIKTNDSIFYETWYDYFNNLLVHNYFFPATSYEFSGFCKKGEKLFAVVCQDFIVATEPTDLNAVKQFLEYNGFHNIRNNDYYNAELGIIFEDLHDENVLSRNRALFFIDTIFYLTGYSF